MRVKDKQQLERTEMMMVRWVCGVTLKNRITSEELRNRLGIESVSEIVRRGRLRWYGHVKRKPNDYRVKRCEKMEIAGKVGRGRTSKTWLQRVNKFGLKIEDTQERQLWRRKIFGETSEPCKHGKTDDKH